MLEPIINTKNDHLVGVQNGGVVVVLPPMGIMSSEEAIRMAAWLVLCAGETTTKRFAEVFEAVLST